jgi:hypothetical protein
MKFLNALIISRLSGFAVFAQNPEKLRREDSNSGFQFYRSP